MIFLKKIDKHLSNLSGWRSKRKFLIIESDDWGSIRMPSLQAFERLKAKGVPLKTGNSEGYNRLDTLAGPDDFSALFDTLSSFKDKNDKCAVFTAMSLSANPDFDKIRANGFEEYFYEPFILTLEKYGIGKSYSFWEEGISQALFQPEFHGREHLNVASWMRALQKKDPFTMAAFDEGFWGFRNPGSSRINFQAAFDLEKYEDIFYQKEVIRTGLDLFETIHGYRASFFVPPNGPFNTELCNASFESGIKYISTAKIHREPMGNGSFKKQFFYLGKKSEAGQYYLVRNCFFEPYQTQKDWVDSCLKDISVAFLWNKPAIISSHRVNYIGVHNEANRTHSLKELKRLLNMALKKWPDIEFLTSGDLGNLIQYN
jgi:hypothetical protein